MRTPLDLLSPNTFANDLYITMQALYLLEKIDKGDVNRFGHEYMRLCKEGVAHPSTALLLRSGVHIHQVQDLSVVHLAQPDGHKYVTTLWSIAGYSDEEIEQKLADYPLMQANAQALLQLAETHRGQWRQEEAPPTASRLMTLAQGSVARIWLSGPEGIMQVLMFGRSDEEFFLYDPTFGGYTCFPQDIEGRINLLEILSRS